MVSSKRLTTLHLIILVAGSALVLRLWMFHRDYVSMVARRADHHAGAMRAAGATDPSAWLSRQIREGRERAAREVDPVRAAALAQEFTEDEYVLRQWRARAETLSTSVRLVLAFMALAIPIGAVLISVYRTRRRRAEVPPPAPSWNGEAESGANPRL